jgi:hypothetical protein
LLVDIPSGSVCTEARDSILDLIEGDVQALHQRRIRDDPILSHLASNRDDLGDARDRQQLRSHDEIRDLSDLHGRSGVACHRNQHDLAHDGSDRPHLGCRAARELFANEREALRNQLAVAVNVGAPIEFRINNRQAHSGDRPHARHARQSVHCALNRERHQLLDLLGRKAVGFSYQGDDGSI